MVSIAIQRRVIPVASNNVLFIVEQIEGNISCRKHELHHILYN